MCLLILPVCFTRPHGMFLVLYRVTNHMAGAPPLTERNWYIYRPFHFSARFRPLGHSCYETPAETAQDPPVRSRSKPLLERGWGPRDDVQEVTLTEDDGFDEQVAAAAGVTEEDPNQEVLQQRAKEVRKKARELAEFAKLQSQRTEGQKAAGRGDDIGIRWDVYIFECIYI